MNEFILSEVNFFLASFVWGILLFFAYDVLRIFRNVFRHAKIVIAIEDIGFWITSGILIFRMMYKMNNGTIRWYAVVAIVVSMKLYQVLASHFVVSLGSDVLLFIKKWIIRFVRWLISPFLFVGKQIKRFLNFIKKAVGKRLKVLSDLMKKRLKTHQQKVKMKKMVKLQKKQQELEKEEKAPVARGILELVPIMDNKGDGNEELKKEKKKKRS